MLTFRLVVNIISRVTKLLKVKKDCGYYLRVYRAIHGLNQEQAAKRFGISNSMWCSVEAARRNFSPLVAERVAIEVGVPLELLVMGADGRTWP